MKAIQIKPSIFMDDELHGCGPEGVLLYIGIAMLSDNGWLDDNPSQIQAKIFPDRCVTVSQLLDELRLANMIRRHKNGRIEISYPTKHFTFPIHSTAASASRRARKIKASPTWADKKAIKEIYKASKRLSQDGEITYHVDHYYPLKGKTVSGLHVHHNLRIIPSTENLKKSNKVPE